MSAGIVIYKWDGKKFVNVNETISKPRYVSNLHTFTMCGRSNVPLRGRTLSPRVNLVCALGIGDYGEESRASTALQV